MINIMVAGGGGWWIIIGLIVNPLVSLSYHHLVTKDVQCRQQYSFAVCKLAQAAVKRKDF